MPETAKTKKAVESLSEIFYNYVDASHDAQLVSQKQYYAAWRNYIESVRDSLKEQPLRDAARAYAQTLHRGLSAPDATQYVQTVRQYADAAKAAELALQKLLQDSYNDLIADVRQILTNGADTQRAEVERFLKSFQEALCGVDIKGLDAATLTRIGYSILAASWFRAQFG